MTEEELAAIEAAVMPYVSAGTTVPSAAHENALRRTWVGYRDALVAEVRRLRAQVEIHGGDPDATLTIKNTIGHGEYVAIQFVERS